MAQVAPFLKPPTPSSSGGGVTPPAADQTTDDDPRPMVPLANYLRRLGGLMMDLFFLFFLMRTLFWAFEDLYMQNIKAFNWAERIIITVYFVLGASHLSEGRTLGKWVMGTRVTDYEGKYLSIPHAFVRTMLLFPGMWFSFYLAELILANPLSYSQQNIWKPGIAMGLNFSLFISTSFAIAFNPFKQGLHDFICGTVVRPSGAPMLSLNEIKNLIGVNGSIYQRQPQYMAGGSFILIFGLVLYQMANAKVSELEEAKFVFARTAPKEEGFPPSRLVAQFVPNVPFVPNEPLPSDAVSDFMADIADTESTTTLKLNAALYLDNRVVPTAEMEQHALTLMERYREEILRDSPATQLVFGKEIEITNSRRRAHTVEFFLVEEYKTFGGFFPSHLEPVKSYTFDFPPFSESTE